VWYFDWSIAMYTCRGLFWYGENIALWKLKHSSILLSVADSPEGATKGTRVINPIDTVGQDI